MAQSRAKTVEEYLNELPDNRREVVSAVRDAILANLPEGYVESMNWGMITYEIPLSQYPDTYNKQPLSLVALAAQKNYYSIYLNCLYQDPERDRLIEQYFGKTGKKLNMGKSCVRFRKIEDLPLDLITEMISDYPPEKFINQYEEGRKR